MQAKEAIIVLKTLNKAFRETAAKRTELCSLLRFKYTLQDFQETTLYCRCMRTHALHWPSQSPDFNPTGHAVYILKTRQKEPQTSSSSEQQ